KGSKNIKNSVKGWCAAFLPPADAVVPVRFLQRLLASIAVDNVTTLKLARWGAALRLGGLLVMSYQDVATDVLVGKSYYDNGDERSARISFGILGVAVFFHMLINFGQNKKKKASARILGLVQSALFLTPLVESYNHWTGKEQDMDEVMPPIILLIASRAIELVVESVPESVLQLGIVLDNPAAATFTMKFSIFASLAAAGAIMTETNISYELSNMNKQKDAVRTFLLSLSAKHALFAGDSVLPEEAGSASSWTYDHLFEKLTTNVKFYEDAALTAEIEQHFQATKAAIAARNEARRNAKASAKALQPAAEEETSQPVAEGQQVAKEEARQPAAEEEARQPAAEEKTRAAELEALSNEQLVELVLKYEREKEESAGKPGCPPEYSSGDDSFSLQRYGEDRAGCTALCNAGGYACTLDSGGCNAIPCTSGCHVAWFSDDVASCKATCNEGNTASCEWTWHHAEVSGLDLSPTWQHGVGIAKCTGSEECGADDWGVSNDCSTSACAAGCDFANDASIRSNFFHGEDVKIDTQIGLDDDELLDAIDKLTRHATGEAALSDADLSAALDQFLSHAELIETLRATLEAALDLVDAFEASSKGPLFMTDATRGGMQRENDGDGLATERAMLAVQQAVLDNVFNGMLPEDGVTDRVQPSIVGECTTFLAGRKWQTANFFPGYVDPPSDPSVQYTVAVDARMPQKWGVGVCFDDEYVLRPLGVYLAPGQVASVTVPQSVVDAGGYRIQVGASIADNVDKSEHKRMDRVSTNFDVTSTVLHVANPLGGGLYVMVPYLADLGEVQVVVSGGVVQAPIFSATSVKRTTEEEWNAVRDAPGVWADFETDKFLMQVPRNWVYGLSYAHVSELMANYDKAMDGISQLGGYPIDKRNKHVLYLQPDLQIREVAYGVGYPQINQIVDSGDAGPEPKGTPGAADHWLVNDPVEWSVTYHEAGHCQLQSFYRGEHEASINVMTPDQSAVSWIVTANFAAGSEMDHSNTPLDEFRYQQRGYSKYVDVARLYGWGALELFYRTENLDAELGREEAGARFGLGAADSRTLRLGIACGYDVSPLIDWWGVHPEEPAKLRAVAEGEGLRASRALKELLVRYASMTPADPAAFNLHYDAVWPGKRGLPMDQHESSEGEYGSGWYEVRAGEWDEAKGAAAKAAAGEVVDRWFPEGTVLAPEEGGGGEG
ncbi:hypothetical protein TeGR_g13725, partial [Tetraparma gracilis]